MIGEIRDQETAEIAVKASITGHLVVSTLHTNSSANTITRLADMGVENYLIADSVVGVIAQRLVRRVCPACGIVREATAGEKKILGIKDPTRRINVRTPGHKECVRCGGTGYYGRIGIYEIMPVTADLPQRSTGRRCRTTQMRRTSYDLIQEQFNLGMKNTVELLTEKNNLLNAQQETLQAKYMAILNAQLLRFYQGEGIQL